MLGQIGVKQAKAKTTTMAMNVAMPVNDQTNGSISTVSYSVKQFSFTNMKCDIFRDHFDIKIYF